MLLSKVYHRGDDAADQQGIDAHHGQNVLGVSLKLLDAAQPGAARVVVLDVVVEGQEGVLRISCSLDGRRRKVDSCCGDRRFALHVVRVIAAGCISSKDTVSRRFYKKNRGTRLLSQN